MHALFFGLACCTLVMHLLAARVHTLVRVGHGLIRPPRLLQRHCFHARREQAAPMRVPGKLYRAFVTHVNVPPTRSS